MILEPKEIQVRLLLIPPDTKGILGLKVIREIQVVPAKGKRGLG